MEEDHLGIIFCYCLFAHQKIVRPGKREMPIQRVVKTASSTLSDKKSGIKMENTQARCGVTIM